MRLPGLAARPQRAQRPSQAVMRPTDLGLGAVARELGEWSGEVEKTRILEDEVQRVEAEEAVRPMLDGLAEEFEPRFAQAGEGWDGETPGFARNVQAALTERTAGFGEELPLTTAERDALARGVSQYGVAVGQRAVQFESQKRGRRIAEAAAARDTVQMGGIMSGFMAAFAADKQAIDNAYDGSQADYTGRVLAAHDARAAEIIAAAPPALQARVTTQLASQRLSLQGQAMDVEARGEGAYVAGQARSAGDLLINAVTTSPALYEDAVAQVDRNVAPLPAVARTAERARQLNTLTEAYVEGLIREGQTDQAIEQLNGGRLDARLDPATKARLLDVAVRKRDEPDANDIINGLQAAATMEDNLASIAATGEGVPGADPASIAPLVSAEQLARYTMAIEEAKRTHAATPGFTGMTPGEISAHVESLRPEPGQAGYADAQQRYSLAGQAAQREIAARTADPAAWAIRSAPTLQTALSGLSAANPVDRQRAAATYAAGQEAIQAEAGIAPEARRVLSKDNASAIVARAEGDADPANGLRGLSAVLEAFEPPTGATAEQMRAGFTARNRVIAELKAAGADVGDIAAALDLGNDPVRLGRYVAATRGEAYETMRGADKTDLEAAVDRAMAPYLASYAAIPGSADLTAGRRAMARRLAAERVATNGASEREAAAEAVDVVAGRYAFIGQQGWRMPRNLADQRDPETRRAASSYVQAGTARLMATMAADDGRLFWTPPDQGRGLNADQRRRRYADTVRTAGRWFTTADDNGLVLMHPNLDGGWTPALDAGGQPIARAWSQLQRAGRAERGGGYARPSDQPRGIRNNNPGNIEFRPENPWRGQTGSDGRFARFATPEAGIRALAIDLGSKSQRGLNSVQSILTAYAPPSENNTAAYVQAVARQLGVAPTARIDLNNHEIRARLMQAIIGHENGMQPYSPTVIWRIAREAIAR